MVYHSPMLDRAFGALADPTRRNILAQLASGEQTIKGLASRYDMTLPGVSKHLRVLERAGLAVIRKEGRVRRATLEAAPLRDAAEWIERYRAFWEHQLTLLSDYIDSTASAEGRSWPQQTETPRSKSARRSARRASASSARGRSPFSRMAVWTSSIRKT